MCTVYMCVIYVFIICIRCPLLWYIIVYDNMRDFRNSKTESTEWSLYVPPYVYSMYRFL